MQKSRRRPASKAGTPKPFAFGAETREQLAKLLYRPTFEPAAIRDVINALERRAGDFVATGPLSAKNSDAAVREVVQRLARAVTRTHETIRALPPKAMGAVYDRLRKERGVKDDVLAQARQSMRLLNYAAVRILSDLAPNPKGGHPVDHRGQQFAADIALILSDLGIEASVYEDGPWAKILEAIFETVKRPTGDMRTLLTGALGRMPADLRSPPRRVR